MHAMRDPTRGGVAGTLNEITRQSPVGMVIDEGKIPVRPGWARPVKRWGSIPSRWLTRQDADQHDPGRCLPIFDLVYFSHSCAEAQIIGEVGISPPAGSPYAPPSALAGFSTCFPATCCRASAEQ